MPDKITLDQEQVFDLVTTLAEAIKKQYRTILGVYSKVELKFYAIPRGGIPVAYLLLSRLSDHFELVMTPEEADFFVDDLIDSGATLSQYATKYQGKPFFALVDKRLEENSPWVVFPWEVGEEGAGPAENVTRLLQFIGEDVKRGGLIETPQRVIQAWQQWTAGYAQDPMEVMKVFEDGGERYDEMVVVRDIPFYSHCEHHLTPFFGTATIGYVPNGKIVGLSKLSRLLDIFAKRLQVQERLTTQVADTLTKALKTKGTGVVIHARHLCMESRGICKQGHETVTSSLSGVMRKDPSTRAEFMALCGK
jgi:GTP cyclohydrolase I